MKVVTVAAPKGGSGKTTTVCLLAVRATQDAQNVCMVDLNADQGSLVRWHANRGRPINPHLVHDIESILGDVRAIHASRKFDWCFLDTPPHDMDIIEGAVMASDCVVIPVRASSLDVNAVQTIVEICKEHSKPYKFLQSDIDPRFKKLNEAALNALLGDGEVFASVINHRMPYAAAMTIGKTGPELDDELQPQVTALWQEVQALAAVTIRPTLRAIKDKRRAAND
jgi:chromosome partitioning protein